MFPPHCRAQSVPYAALLCLFPLLFFTLPREGIAHHLEEQAPLPDWALNRTHSLARDGPMARYFANDTDGKEALITLRDHFRKVESTMAHLRRTSDYGRTAIDDLCNQQHAVIMKAAGVKIRTLGFGQFRSRCLTELKSSSSRELFDAIMRFQVSVRRAGAKVLREKRVRGWTRPYTHSNFTYRSSINRCELAHAVAFRVRGDWALLASVTQYPVNIRRERRRRQYIEEFLRPGQALDDPVRNLFMTLPPVENREGRAEKNSTTSLSVWGGIPASSIFAERVPLAKNRGIAAALVEGRQWREQAEDAQTSSNIAIMVLSLTLALVPIALFADVSRLVAICYALVTDVVSCMPLFIKGVELINHSQISNWATRTWVYGMDVEGGVGIAETWTARCQSNVSLFRSGVAFIGVATLAMVVGMTLEILTRRKLQRNKRVVKVMDMESKNHILKQLWAKEPPCWECPCYAMQCELQESEQFTKPLGSSGILTARIKESCEYR